MSRLQTVTRQWHEAGLVPKRHFASRCPPPYNDSNISAENAQQGKQLS
jgi:hypothetical protein